MLSKVWPNASQPPKAGAFAKSHVCGKHFKEQVSRCMQNDIFTMSLGVLNHVIGSEWKSDTKSRFMTHCACLQDWGSCRGSSPGTRGYTCALWLLFHSLAAHVTGDTGGALWMAAVKCALLSLSCSASVRQLLASGAFLE